MTPQQLKRWSWIHTWSSLICTIFMLLLCITGLPLIFHHEIEHALGTAIEAPELPAHTTYASMDTVLASAQARHPTLQPLFAFREEDDTNLWVISFAKNAQSEDRFFVAVDSRTSQILKEPQFDQGLMYVMYKLHVDLFAGLAGMLFLGLMGMLMIVAIISGVVLYKPFMHKLKFAQIRQQRSKRIKWLDLHNALGMVTLSWLLVVGATGVINTWADLVIKLWQFDQMTEMTAAYQHLDTPKQLGSLEQAVRHAQALEPQMELGFIAFPNTQLSSPHHYTIFMRGTEPFNSRLFKPVLVDAQTSQVTDSRELPWYVTTLLVSQPLHFGDYAGMPMKILWAILDLLSIMVLISGLYLWWKKRHKPKAMLENR